VLSDKFWERGRARTGQQELFSQKRPVFANRFPRGTLRRSWLMSDQAIQRARRQCGTGDCYNMPNVIELISGLLYRERERQIRLDAVDEEPEPRNRGHIAYVTVR